jgi:hypothetical protein
MSKAVVLKNVGPIEKLEFNFGEPGITVLVAPNGSGKSLALHAVQAAAAGKGKVPLRDHARKGLVQAFGAKITIGGTCRHTGEFESENLEGRFDIGGLIDPKIKNPEAADAARIKALVSLTGIEADPELFKVHEAFEDWGTIVTEGSLETDDLVEMARRIKRDYDKAGKGCANDAERSDAKAVALQPAEDIDLTATSDAELLSEFTYAVRDELKTMRSDVLAYDLKEGAAADAREQLKGLDPGVDIDALRESIETAEKLRTIHFENAAKMRDEITRLESEASRITDTIDSSLSSIEAEQQRSNVVNLAEAIIVTFSESECPTPADIAQGEKNLAAAQEAQEQGTLIRTARAAAEKAFSLLWYLRA